MRKILSLIIGLLACSNTNASALNNEASMNFDLENVVPFLIELDNKFKFGLDATKLGNFSSTVPIDTEKSIVVDISYSGRKTKMEFRTFMDDIDAPDIYLFFDSPELSESVGDFMMEWAEARGM